MDATKTCQACTQPIPAAARRCPHCHARQAQPMHRGHPGKMIGGVCAALGEQFGIDAAIVRVFFAIAVAVSGGLGFGVYLLLWALTPPEPGGVAPAGRWMDRAGSIFGGRSGAPVSEPPPPSEQRL